MVLATITGNDSTTSLDTEDEETIENNEIDNMNTEDGRAFT